MKKIGFIVFLFIYYVKLVSSKNKGKVNNGISDNLYIYMYVKFVTDRKHIISNIHNVYYTFNVLQNRGSLLHNS